MINGNLPWMDRGAARVIVFIKMHKLARLAEQSILLGSMNESAVVEPIRKTKCLDGLKTWNIPIVTMMVDTWTAMDDRAGIVPQAMVGL